MLAMMTSAICSTGIAGVPRTSGLRRSSAKPQATPSRKEPLMTRVGGEHDTQHLQADHRDHRVDGRHQQQSFGDLPARARLMGDGQHDHRRGRQGHGACHGGRQPGRAEPHQRARHQRAAQQRLQQAARGEPAVVEQPARSDARAEFEQQRADGQVDQRLPGIELQAFEQAQHHRPGDRPREHVAADARDAPGAVQHLGEQQGHQHQQRQAEHRVGGAQSVERPQRGRRGVGDGSGGGGLRRHQGAQCSPVACHSR
jgi:hypothetical protein